MSEFKLSEAQPERMPAGTADENGALSKAERDVVFLDNPGLREVIGGTDDRKQVTASMSAYPFTCFAHLKILYEDGQTGTGTGWLAAPHVVITAGHCLMRHLVNNSVIMPKLVRVFPARNNAADPSAFIDVPPGNYRVAQAFRNLIGGLRNDAADYGAIRLPQPIGNQANFVETTPFQDAQLQGLPFNLIGYPDDVHSQPPKPSGTLWGQTGKLQQPSPQFLFYDIDTTIGQSGAPVFAFIQKRAFAAGIHISGSTQFRNMGVRISPPVAQEIHSWLI